MGWIQTKGFDVGKAGTQKYLCLKNVRLGYGIPSKWEYARQDWDNNVAKHADQNFPAGVAVPVYFSWVGTLDGVKRDWGHVAVRMPDGRIWTDGKYYANVSELSKNYISGGTYLGWGESVNGVRVVEYVPEPVRKSNEEIASEVIQGKWGNGTERKRRLTEAGYNYDAVQAIVNARVNTPAPQPAPAAQYYTVAKGDSLSKIAARYGTTWQKLYEMNRQVIGSDPNKIFPGQKLRVK